MKSNSKRLESNYKKLEFDYIFLESNSSLEKNHYFYNNDSLIEKEKEKE